MRFMSHWCIFNEQRQRVYNTTCIFITHQLIPSHVSSSCRKLNRVQLSWDTVHCYSYLHFNEQFLPSVLWHCWLGDRKDIRPVKSWTLVCWWWWFDCFARLIAPVVTTTSIILSSNKNRPTQVHLEKMAVKTERTRETERWYNYWYLVKQCRATVQHRQKQQKHK